MESDRPTPDGPESDSSHDDWADPRNSGTDAGTGADYEVTDDLPDFALDEFDETAPPAGTHTALPPKLEAWRRRSAAGAILTGFALGLQEALEKRKEEPAIVMQTSGDPPKDLPVEADFEYGRPRQSVVQIRPWLLTDGDSATGQPEGKVESLADGVDEAGGDEPGET